ncbi:hypothetical protein AB0I98_38605 [Streptomyces sp. NPDC050211]|uniref:hypothetical protein n=1 Tax=Streptomyces sp. NPDC050211 TaxID=3154932 RepID=UPI003414BEAE
MQRDGLGRIRRVHRERLRWGFPMTAGAVIAVAVCVGMDVQGVFDRHHWTAAAVPLVPLLTLGMAAAYVLFATLPGYQPRRWVAVCDGGLLVWSLRGPDREVIPWEAITGLEGFTGSYPANVTDQLLWTEEDRKRTLGLGAFTGRRDLFRAITVRGPVRRTVAGQVAAAGAVAGLLALVTWQVALPYYAPVTVSDAADDVADYARACEKAGARFEGAARYDSRRGASALAVFTVGEDGLVDSSEGARRLTGGRGSETESPDTVELVGCSHRIGRGPTGLVKSCSYSNDIFVEHYQGRYRVDVYEARTYHKVGSVTVNGGVDVSCGFIATADYEGEVLERETEPDDNDYASALERFLS